MLARIHCGNTTLWLGGHGDPLIEDLLSRPYLQTYRNPSPAEMDTALKSLSQGKGSDILMLDASQEKLLHEISARLYCIDAAGGLVTDAYGRFLMIHRRGFWDLPKGKLDEGESLEACALREVEEETGLSSIRSDGFLLTTYHVYRQDGVYILKRSHWYRMSFFGTETAIPQTEEDIERIEWLTGEQVSERLPEAYPSIREVMEAIGLS